MEGKTPEINPVVVLRKEFDDWAVLFNPDTAEAVGINPIGVDIWEQLSEHRPVPAIIDAIRDKYQGVPEEVQDEVNTFITSLIERGFLGFAIENTE